jgi:Spy/CpxP family protein refolding chaperone
MNRTKLLTIAVIGLLIINLGTLGMMFLAKSVHPMHPEGPNGEGPKKIIIERLHFDEQQQQKYQLLVDEHMDKTKELHNESRGMHDELFVLLKEEPVDKTKADSMIQSIANNQKAIEQLNFEHFQKIKMLCKPEQVKEFNSLVDELGELFAPKGRPH